MAGNRVIPAGSLLMDHPSPNEPIFKAGHQAKSDDPYEFILSDESVDRVGDVIRVKGWRLEEFKKNPIALFGHSHEKIIGVWRNVRVQGKQLLGNLKLAEPGTSELVDTVRALVEQRILTAVSVGFRPLQAKERVKGEPWEGYEYTESALHEASLVAVGANANALRKSLQALHPDVADDLFVRLDAEGGSNWDNPPGKSAFETVPTPKLDRYAERFKRFDIY